MSKQFNNSIEIKVDKSTLPIDGQKVKFLYKDEWFEGEYDDNEELFSTKHGFYFAWQVHEWQPVDETPRREHLPLSREQAEKVWDAAAQRIGYLFTGQGNAPLDKEEYLKQFDKQ